MHVVWKMYPFYEHLSIKKLIVQNGLLVLSSRNILDLLKKELFRWFHENIYDATGRVYGISSMLDIDYLKNGWFGNSVNL